MDRRPKGGGGSFGELRARHLPLFGKAVHRHDRGWPHEAAEEAATKRRAKNWKTVGIFHFRHDEEEDG